jgi:hypothetical protein
VEEESGKRGSEETSECSTILISPDSRDTRYGQVLEAGQDGANSDTNSTYGRFSTKSYDMTGYQAKLSIR